MSFFDRIISPVVADYRKAPKKTQRRVIAMVTLAGYMRDRVQAQLLPIVKNAARTAGAPEVTEPQVQSIVTELCLSLLSSCTIPTHGIAKHCWGCGDEVLRELLVVLVLSEAEDSRTSLEDVAYSASPDVALAQLVARLAHIVGEAQGALPGALRGPEFKSTWVGFGEQFISGALTGMYRAESKGAGFDLAPRLRSLRPKSQAVVREFLRRARAGQIRDDVYVARGTDSPKVPGSELPPPKKPMRKPGVRTVQDVDSLIAEVDSRTQDARVVVAEFHRGLLKGARVMKGDVDLTEEMTIPSVVEKIYCLVFGLVAMRCSRSDALFAESDCYAGVEKFVREKMESIGMRAIELVVDPSGPVDPSVLREEHDQDLKEVKRMVVDYAQATARGEPAGAGPLEKWFKKKAIFPGERALADLVRDTLNGDRVPMSEADTHEFGSNIVAKYVAKDGYKLDEVDPRLSQAVQIRATKQGQTYLVAVRTAIYPNKGELSRADRRALVELSSRRGAVPCFASVGIANAKAIDDKGRARVVRGGAFHVSYAGLETLE